MSRASIISEWFYLYGNDVYRFLVYYTGNVDVEDLVQEVFIKALINVNTFKGNSSPKTWLFTIARNLAIDEMRNKKKSRWNKFLSIDDMEKELATNELNPEKVFFYNHQAKELYDLIQLLNKNYKEIIVLRGINQLSVDEAATVLNWSKEKVRTTYHRALKTLRNQWREIP
ncbi:RNA polymerase sigma factor [Lederbergia graminis]|uniref:RNA polymerase sigma factor n=1 Tax=Lederbergia graminis TaxID=735518 RepID=A0ABW0LGY4_9BACI